MSLGEEVVWLTNAETTATPEEDVEHYRRRGLWTEEEIEENAAPWLADGHRADAPSHRSR
jgi:hypothetical protein